jgi:hypothetical protein
MNGSYCYGLTATACAKWPISALRARGSRRLGFKFILTMAAYKLADLPLVGEPA